MSKWFGRLGLAVLFLGSLAAMADDFEPSSCDGSPMTLQSAARYFAAGATKADLGTFTMKIRGRTCTILSCTDWQDVDNYIGTCRARSSRSPDYKVDHLPLSGKTSLAIDGSRLKLLVEGDQKGGMYIGNSGPGYGYGEPCWFETKGKLHSWTRGCQIGSRYLPEIFGGGWTPPDVGFGHRPGDGSAKGSLERFEGVLNEHCLWAKTSITEPHGNERFEIEIVLVGNH